MALSGHGPAVREPVIAWALGQVERATALRRARTTLAPRNRPAARRTALAFLLPSCSPRARIDRLARRALAVLGAPRPAASSGAASAPTTPRSGPRRSRRSTRSATAARRGARPAPRRRCRPDVRDRDAALAPAVPMMTTRGSWPGRTSPGRSGRDGRDTAGRSATSRRCCCCAASPCSSGLEPEDLQRIARRRVERVYPAERRSSARATSATSWSSSSRARSGSSSAEPDGTRAPDPAVRGGRPHRRAGRAARAPRAATVDRRRRRRARPGHRRRGPEGDPARATGSRDGDAGDARRADQPPVTVHRSRTSAAPSAGCRPGRSRSCGPTSRARWGSPGRSGRAGTRSTQRHLGRDRPRCRPGTAASCVRTEGDAIFAAFPGGRSPPSPPRPRPRRR